MLLSSTRKHRRQLEQQLHGVGACPHCGGGLPRLGVSVCMHCQNDLVWYKHIVGKPGQEVLCKSQYTKSQYTKTQARGSRRRQATNEKLMKFCGPAFFLFIPFFFYCLFTANPFIGFRAFAKRLFLWDLADSLPAYMAVPIVLLGMAWPVAFLMAPFIWVSIEDTVSAKQSAKPFIHTCRCGKNKFDAKTCPHCHGRAA